MKKKKNSNLDSLMKINFLVQSLPNFYLFLSNLCKSLIFFFFLVIEKLTKIYLIRYLEGNDFGCPILDYSSVLMNDYVKTNRVCGILFFFFFSLNHVTGFKFLFFCFFSFLDKTWIIVGSVVGAVVVIIIIIVIAVICYKKRQTPYASIN